MEYALHRKEGFVVITGGPGTGKTTLIDDLLEDLSRSDLNIAKLTGSRLDGSEVLLMVGYAFRIPVDGIDKAQVLNRIQHHMERDFQRGRRSLLVIDEAQGLAHTALEELRLLTNLRIHGKPILQIFLVGQEDLRERLMDKCQEQLHQRIVAACHLEPLTLEQTVLYVLHRLRVAGWQGRPKLKSKLFPLLHEFSHGIPRRINTACSRMLLHGALEEQDEITIKEMRLVISELKSERLLREGTISLPDSNHTKLEHLTELIEQNTPTNPSPVSVQKTEQEQSETSQSGKPSLTAQEPVMQPEPVIQQENTEQAEQLETPTSKQQGKKRKMGVDAVPLRGFAAALFLLISILVIGFMLASRQELRRIAPEAFWSEIGIIKIRDLIFPWAGKSVPQQQDPQSLQNSIPNQQPTIHGMSGDRPQLPDTEHAQIQQLPKASQNILQNPTPPVSGGETTNILTPDNDADLTDPDMERGALAADDPMLKEEPPQDELQDIPVVKYDAEPEETKSDTEHAQIHQLPMASLSTLQNPAPPVSEGKITNTPTPDNDADLSDPDMEGGALAADDPVPKEEPSQNESHENPAVKSDAEPEETRPDFEHVHTQLRGKPNLPTMVEVAFRFNSAEVKPKYQQILDETAYSLNAMKKSMAHIIGFTDSVGARRYNTMLSKKRASAVANYLRKKGVSEHQLQIEGRGESELQVDRRGKNAQNRVVRIYTNAINIKSQPKK